MNKYLPIIVLLMVFASGDACADDIFDKLANKAAYVGAGLREGGFIIAGLGMIMFTFMAIFNKLQWKHLAYIMFSTAVLSGMIALISEISGKKNSDIEAGMKFNHSGYQMTDTEAPGDVMENQVDQSQ